MFYYFEELTHPLLLIWKVKIKYEAITLLLDLKCCQLSTHHAMHGLWHISWMFVKD